LKTSAPRFSVNISEKINMGPKEPNPEPPFPKVKRGGREKATRVKKHQKGVRVIGRQVLP
jgi:hypothetical protein